MTPLLAARSTIRLALTLALALPAGIGSLAPQAARAAAPEVGERAPSFSLQGSDGRTHSLSDFAGKKAVVLAWFPKAFTPG